MSPAARTHPRSSERSARSPWSTEPELPPDRRSGSAQPGFDAHAALTLLDDEARLAIKELSVELDRLRPMLAVESTSQGDYVSAIRRLAAAEQTALDVAAARARLDDGTYGFCVACTEPIPPGRLELRPHSRLCVTCS